MSEINLLPEGQRKGESQERREAQHIPGTSPVEYTGGERSNPTAKPGGNLLRRLFARTPKEPSLPPVASTPPPPAVPRGVPPADAPEHPGWFKRMFGAKPAASVPSTEPPVAVPPSPPAPSGPAHSFGSFWQRRSAASHGASAGSPFTSLLPKEYLRSGRHTFAYLQLTTAAFVSGGIVALSFWLLLQLETAARAQLENARADVTIVEREIAARSKEQARATTLQRKVNAAQKLLDRHVHWTRALSFLESRTVVDVQYTSMAVDLATNKISLEASGRSFAALARQLVAFQSSPEIKSVSITSGEVKGEEKSVAFKVELELFPEVLQEKAPAPRAQAVAPRS